MKKFENLGKKLSKEEQKKYSGGSYPTTCALCSGGNVMCSSGDCNAVDYEGLYCLTSQGVKYYPCPS